MDLTVIFKGILCELEEGAKIIVNTSHALQIDVRSFRYKVVSIQVVSIQIEVVSIQVKSRFDTNKKSFRYK